MDRDAAGHELPPRAVGGKRRGDEEKAPERVPARRNAVVFDGILETPAGPVRLHRITRETGSTRSGIALLLWLYRGPARLQSESRVVRSGWSTRQRERSSRPVS